MLDVRGGNMDIEVGSESSNISHHKSSFSHLTSHIKNLFLMLSHLPKDGQAVRMRSAHEDS